MIPPEEVSSVCAWCERTRNDEGEWSAIGGGGLAPLDATHGICPDCLERETRVAVVYGAFGPADEL